MDRPEPPTEGDLFPGGTMMPADWSHAHDLVNMYLGIAHFADNELAPEEQRIFMKKFDQWIPNVSLEEFQEIWSEVTTAYEALASREARYASYLQSAVNVASFLRSSKDKLRALDVAEKGRVELDFARIYQLIREEPEFEIVGFGSEVFEETTQSRGIQEIHDRIIRASGEVETL